MPTHESDVLSNVAKSSTTAGEATAKPTRQPLMLYDLLKV